MLPNENSIKKDLIKYWSSIGQEFSSKIDRVSHLIGDEHQPSSGRYRERLLIEMITKFLPKKYDVGTGFILFPTLFSSDSKKSTYSTFTHEVSKEIDIIIYDSLNYSPIYKDGDFIIVKPESVRSVIEVKSTLNLEEIQKSVNNYIDLAFKWLRFDNYYQKFYRQQQKQPGLFIMNWACRKNRNKKPLPRPETVLKKIISTYNKAEVLKLYYGKFFPFLSACFMYNKFIINDCISLCIDGSTEYTEYVYTLSSGKYDEPEYESYAFYGDDKTVSSLLYYLDLFLDTPRSNTTYTRPTSMFPVRTNNHVSLPLFSFTQEEYIEFLEGQKRS